MHREHAAQLEIRVEHDLRARHPAQAIELRLDQFVPEAQRQHHLRNAAFAQRAQMPLEQGHAAETQQALGHLLVLRLLQTQTAAGCENDGAHSILRL